MGHWGWEWELGIRDWELGFQIWEGESGNVRVGFGNGNWEWELESGLGIEVWEWELGIRDLNLRWGLRFENVGLGIRELGFGIDIWE